MKLVIELEVDSSEIASVVHVLEVLKRLENSPGVRMTVASGPTGSPGHTAGTARSVSDHDSDEESPTAEPVMQLTEEDAKNMLRQRFIMDLQAVRNMKDEDDFSGQVFNQVVVDVRQVLDASSRGRVSAVDVLFEVLSEVLFNTQRVQMGLPVIGYVSLLARLQDPYKTQISEGLKKVALKHLTIKRSVDCDRVEFFAYAETFAAFAKVEFIPIVAAISTITKLLRKPENRCASITMLGKTIELCLHIILEKCDPAKLEELRAALSMVTEEVFRYDVSYITGNMSWSQLTPQSVVGAGQFSEEDEEDSNDEQPSQGSPSSLEASGSRTPSEPDESLEETAPLVVQALDKVLGTKTEQKLTTSTSATASATTSATTASTTNNNTTATSTTTTTNGTNSGASTAISAVNGSSTVEQNKDRMYSIKMVKVPCKAYLKGHQNKIYAIAYDEERDSLISSSCDGTVISWDGPSGRIASTFGLPGFYSCSMSYNSGSKNLYMCGVPLERTSTPALLRFTSSPVANSAARQWSPSGVMARVVLCTRTLNPARGDWFVTGESVVGECDGLVRIYDGGARSMEEQRPVTSYNEHSGYITTLCTNNRSWNMIMSGSQDGTMRMWDDRQPKSVLCIVPDQEHDVNPMVTSVDWKDDFIASGLYSGIVDLWDVRKISMPVFMKKVDETPVLKVAMCPYTSAAEPIIAVGTNSVADSLHILTPRNPLDSVLPVDTRDPCNFCELAWGRNGKYGEPILYAAGNALGLFAPIWI